MISIYIDRRERGFLTHIGDLGEVKVVQLEAGDYIVKTGLRSVVIERKTLGDFVSSFRSGRWARSARPAV